MVTSDQWFHPSPGDSVQIAHVAVARSFPPRFERRCCREGGRRPHGRKSAQESQRPSRQCAHDLPFSPSELDDACDTTAESWLTVSSRLGLVVRGRHRYLIMGLKRTAVDREGRDVSSSCVRAIVVRRASWKKYEQFWAGVSHKCTDPPPREYPQMLESLDFSALPGGSDKYVRTCRSHSTGIPAFPKLLLWGRLAWWHRLSWLIELRGKSCGKAGF